MISRESRKFWHMYSTNYKNAPKIIKSQKMIFWGCPKTNTATHTKHSPRDATKFRCLVTLCSGDFKLLKTGKSALCLVSSTAKKHEGNLWNGGSNGLEDCRSKCAANSKCKYFSLWISGNYCELHSVCNHWGSDSYSGSQISTYGRNGGMNLSALMYTVNLVSAGLLLLMLFFFFSVGRHGS